MVTAHSKRRSALVLLAATCIGAAADARPPAPPTPEPPLRGPDVREREVPGSPGAFGSEEGARRQAERIPPPVFRDAVMSLRADDTAPELRLSDDQAEALRRLQQDFERRRREHAAAHRDDLRRLREQAGPRERQAQGEMTPQRREALDKLREIERAAPQPEDLYTKVWEELTPAQREAVEARLDEFRAQRAREREERYVRQRAPRGERPGTAPEMMEMPAPPGEMAESPRRRRAAEDGPGPEGRARIDRLIRVFNQLPPDAQERLLRRLEAHVAELSADRPASDRPAEPGRRQRRRPPPSMDEVDVPPPSEGGEPR